MFAAFWCVFRLPKCGGRRLGAFIVDRSNFCPMGLKKVNLLSKQNGTFSNFLGGGSS
jgi:hypothetical protein